MKISHSFYFKEDNQQRFVLQRDFSVLFNDWYSLEIFSVQKSNLSRELAYLRLTYLCSLALQTFLYDKAKEV